MNAAPSSASDETALASAVAMTAASAAPAANRTRFSGTSELVSAMIAVSPAIATAATRPDPAAEDDRDHERRENQDQNESAGIASPPTKPAAGTHRRPDETTCCGWRVLAPRPAATSRWRCASLPRARSDRGAGVPLRRNVAT